MDFDDIDALDWAAAKRRAEVLSKLPERPSGEQLGDAMAALRVGRTTLFRWLRLFRESGRTSALLPRRRGPNSGMRPLAPEVLAIVDRHFRDFYATRRRPTVTRFWAEVAADCRREGVPVPSIRRLRRWLARHDAAELLRRREGKAKSEPVYLATPGTLEAAAPLAIMQIEADERLSSWLSRIARIYDLSSSGLLAQFGVAGASALALERDVSVAQGALIIARTGLDVRAIKAMTYSDLAPRAYFMIAPRARYFCPQCAVTPAIGRKDAALPWTFWCCVHGVRLWAHEGQPMESFLPPSVLERLDPLARSGAARLAAWARRRDPVAETGSPAVPDLLQFLTAPYRRASPPSLAEQPRLSLEARRANHGFLTLPITDRPCSSSRPNTTVSRLCSPSRFVLAWTPSRAGRCCRITP